jgi:hypothetical protein
MYICFGGTDYPALIRLLWCGEIIRLLLLLYDKKDKIVVVDLRGLPFCLFISITLPLAFFSLLLSYNSHPHPPLFPQHQLATGFPTLLCPFLHYCSYFPFGP